MMGHTASIYSLAFSAESSLLASGGADWTVRCWDVKAAGGSPGKVNGSASYSSSNDAASTRRSWEEDNIETCAPFVSVEKNDWLICHDS
jgi:transcription initiation factor TFIID subunit 5